MVTVCAAHREEKRRATHRFKRIKLQTQSNMEIFNVNRKKKKNSTTSHPIYCNGIFFEKTYWFSFIYTCNTSQWMTRTFFFCSVCITDTSGVQLKCQQQLFFLFGKKLD